ncbi:Cop9 signalosome complex subunit 12 [Nakaseomyces bracarensis]|uniref:Cop9 signalosome complex subunit 12 n=1 Tax=Nakaseomyces bracarensis TaxID=273131 RepID=A0ABR4NQ14_9SACH
MCSQTSSLSVCCFQGPKQPEDILKYLKNFNDEKTEGPLDLMAESYCRDPEVACTLAMNYSSFVDCFERKQYSAEFLKFAGFKLSDGPTDSSTAVILSGQQPKLSHLGDANQLYDIVLSLKLKDEISILRSLGEEEVLRRNKQKKVYQKVRDVFSVLTEELRVLNKILERNDDSSWLVYPVYVVCRDVTSFIRDMGKYMQLDTKKQLWEECIRVIHRSFMICLNDKNPDMKENKRSGCILFSNLEMMLYKMLKNRDMMKNLIKVLESTGMTDIDRLYKNKLLNRHRSQRVIFNYFVGEYYGCYLFQFQNAHKHLKACVEEYPKKYVTAQWFKRIAHLYSQFTMLAVPNKLVRINIPGNDDGGAYDSKVMSQCYKNGDTIVFDNLIRDHAMTYLVDGTYSAMLLIKELVLLRLIKICFQVNDKKSILPLELVAASYKIHFRVQDNEDMTTTTNKRKIQKKNEDLLDELECRIANLISNGKIKGYLSHSQRCMVLSKKDPFPTN